MLCGMCETCTAIFFFTVGNTGQVTGELFVIILCWEIIRRYSADATLCTMYNTFLKSEP